MIVEEAAIITAALETLDDARCYVTSTSLL